MRITVKRKTIGREVSIKTIMSVIAILILHFTLTLAITIGVVTMIFNGNDYSKNENVENNINVENTSTESIMIEEVEKEPVKIEPVNMVYKYKKYPLILLDDTHVSKAEDKTNIKVEELIVEEKTEEMVIQERLEFLNIDFSEDFNINGISGLTLEEIDMVLSYYPALQPYAEDFYNIEQENNVNVLFSISVTVLESGHGKSALATDKNNLFGFLRNRVPLEFETKEDCIDYFGRLIEKYYIGEGLDTPSTISYKYDPNDPTGWSFKVTRIMNQMMDRLSNDYKNKLDV